MKTYTTYKSQIGGFTLIELMIVVAIIGLLAAIAIPNFQNYQCKSRQAEAQLVLGQIKKAQEVYFSENNRYSSSLGRIGLEISNNANYSASILSASGTGYTAKTHGRNSGKDDVWVASVTGPIRNVTNACNQ